MHEDLSWWLPTVVVLGFSAAAVVALRLWSKNLLAALVLLAVLSSANVAALLLTSAQVRLAPLTFGGLGFLYGVAVLISVVWRPRVTKASDDCIAGLLAFSLLGLTALATRSYDANWSTNSSQIVGKLFITTIILSIYVGKGSYNLLIEQEKASSHREGSCWLLTTVSTSIALIAAGIQVVLLLRNPLGFDLPTSSVGIAPQLGAAIPLTVSAGIASVGALIAFLRQPHEKTDDRLRVDPIAGTIALTSLVYALIILVRDLTVPSVPWAAITPYAMILAVAVTMLYFEDLVTSAVRIHAFRNHALATIVAFLCAINVGAATYWLIASHLWVGPWKGVPLGQAAGALGCFVLAAVTTAAGGLVLGFGSSDTQQFTIKRAAHNVVQGQFLYGILVAIISWAPSFLVARLSLDILADVPILTLLLGLATILPNLYKYSIENNREHLERETLRQIPEIDSRTSTKAERIQLKTNFVQHLGRHMLWQKYLSLAVLMCSVIGVCAPIALFWDKVKNRSSAVRIAS